MCTLACLPFCLGAGFRHMATLVVSLGLLPFSPVAVCFIASRCAASALQVLWVEVLAHVDRVAAGGTAGR